MLMNWWSGIYGFKCLALFLLDENLKLSEVQIQKKGSLKLSVSGLYFFTH
jgi:hypothetical protein